MENDPNRRCTCGYRRFRERRQRSESTITRWALFDAIDDGGFGATPLGTLLGSSGTYPWGEFDATLYTTTQQLVCESCQRVRSTKTLGSAAFFGSYVSGSEFVVVASDLTSDSCYELLMEGMGVRTTLSLQYVSTLIPAALVAATPPVVAETLPVGAQVANQALVADIPEVYATGNYAFTLIDRCGDLEIPLATVLLEEPPMIIHPSSAHRGGFPYLWIKQVLNTPTQVSFGSGKGIPLEYCEGVLEYNAREGTLPSSQGWSFQNGGGGGAPSNWALVEGGILRGGTPTGGNPSYWDQTLVLSGVPTQVHSYATYLVDSTTTTGTASGLDLQALFASVGGPYLGHRTNYHGGGLYTTTLSGASDDLIDIAGDAQGWHTTALSTSAADRQLIHNEIASDVATVYGTEAGTPVSAELVARFGDFAGQGFVAYIRNYVVSHPGRFMRAEFVMGAPVTNPVVRLYLIRDSVAAGSLTTRLKVNYGAGTASPYEVPATTTTVTVNMPTANAVVEVPIELSGLTANQPFFFTVERDWSHADDLLQSAAWLLQATVRSS